MELEKATLRERPSNMQSKFKPAACVKEKLIVA
jgi:hypothetical protein